MIRAGEAGGFLRDSPISTRRFHGKITEDEEKGKIGHGLPSRRDRCGGDRRFAVDGGRRAKVSKDFRRYACGSSTSGPDAVVINISTFLQEQLLLSLILGISIVFGGRFFLKTSRGSHWFDWSVLKLPQIGSFSSKSNLSRITRTFGTLLSSGVPMLQAITITREIASNRLFAEALLRIHNQVRDGEALSRTMAQESVFPDMVTSMVDVGEESGTLPDMLARIADNYDDEIDNTVASMTSIIEPTMIVFLALVVGFIVIALFLPIIEIIRQLT